MSERAIFLGIDGGGTKTEFVCISQSGEVLASHREGTTYHLQVGLEAAAEVLRKGVNAVCAQLAAEPADIAYAFFGLPAFGEDGEIDPQLERVCGELMGHGRYRCGNDMICGWAGSLACEDGINLVAGTGSIGYGERAGRTARAGGWGEVFGDEGSAYWIAAEGLNAFTRMSDGRVPRGPLHGTMREALSLIDDLDLCARVMGRRGMGRDEIASLTRVVEQAALEGDACAQDILRRAASELAQLARTLRTSLGYMDAEIALISCSGGVLTRVQSVRDAFERELASAGGFRFVEPRHEPSYGAALYAKRLAENA